MYVFLIFKHVIIVVKKIYFQIRYFLFQLVFCALIFYYIIRFV